MTQHMPSGYEQNCPISWHTAVLVPIRLTRADLLHQRSVHRPAGLPRTRAGEWKSPAASALYIYYTRGPLLS